MHLSLKRWLRGIQRLTNLEFGSSGCEDATENIETERLEQAKSPTKYICEELASEYAKYWKKIQDDHGEGLEEIQQKALVRWHSFRFNFGKSTDKYPLPLDFFVKVFDDYFFLGSVRQYIRVDLADDTLTNSDWVGLTKSNRSHMLSGLPEIQIELKRPPPVQLWTRELIQDLLDTLLHEMIHAFLIIYSTPGRFLERWVETEGLTGHGHCWVQVAASVAAEADRSLGDSWGKWDLKIEDSCRLEKEAFGRNLDMVGKPRS